MCLLGYAEPYASDMLHQLHSAMDEYRLLFLIAFPVLLSIIS
jgi:hypothetical protein